MGFGNFWDSLQREFIVRSRYLFAVQAVSETILAMCSMQPVCGCRSEDTEAEEDEETETDDAEDETEEDSEQWTEGGDEGAEEGAVPELASAPRLASPSEETAPCSKRPRVQ